MYIDITLKINREQLTEAVVHQNTALIGHAGTHFDVMDKEFPLAYTERAGIVFDVRHISGRDIEISDIDPEQVQPEMFVAFCTGFSGKEPYGTKTYYAEHPQLSWELIELLLSKGVSIIGLDFAGIRRGKEHIPTDQRCADRDVFVIENLYGLEAVLSAGGRFTACTYPMNCTDMTGLPCRVVAKL